MARKFPDKPEGVRDPSSHRTPQQVRKQVTGYNAKPEMVKRRTMQNGARATLMKEGVVKKGDGLDVDHRKMLDKGGTNKRSNLRAVPRSRNRGWADGKV